MLTLSEAEASLRLISYGTRICNSSKSDSLNLPSGPRGLSPTGCCFLTAPILGANAQYQCMGQEKVHIRARVLDFLDDLHDVLIVKSVVLPNLLGTVFHRCAPHERILELLHDALVDAVAEVLHCVAAGRHHHRIVVVRQPPLPSQQPPALNIAPLKKRQHSFKTVHLESCSRQLVSWCKDTRQQWARTKQAQAGTFPMGVWTHIWMYRLALH